MEINKLHYLQHIRHSRFCNSNETKILQIIIAIEVFIVLLQSKIKQNEEIFIFIYSINSYYKL